MSVNVILVDKTGSLKSVAVKEFNETELFKRAGFKKPDGFEKQTEWNVKLKDKRYLVSVFAKLEGRANTENKYDFPPPIDTTLFFGTCVIVCREKESKHGQSVLCDLSVELWEKIYEKLFGGFEDLTLTCVEDENEEDELANVPAEKKTKNGYLKDGFVVDSDDDDDDDDADADVDDSSSEFEDEDDEESGSGENLDDTNTTNTNTNSNTTEDESDAELEEEDYE